MLIPIQSQIISAVSYDAAAQCLFVQLRSGNGYVYDDVPRRRAQGLVDAASPGRYFNANIRAKHEGCRVEGVFG